jgi:hypothetical protein
MNIIWLAIAFGAGCLVAWHFPQPKWIIKLLGKKTP